MGSLESPMQDTISYLPLLAWDLGSIFHNIPYPCLAKKKTKAQYPTQSHPIHIFPAPSSLTSVTEICPTN